MQFDNEAKIRMENNKKVLESLFKIVMLCGRQELALRGYRDDQIDWIEEEQGTNNRGNFIELVCF